MTDPTPDDHAPPGFLAWVARLVHAHRGALLASARRRGLSADESLDVVQDAFVTFLRLPAARSIAGDPDDALKLLHVIVKHQCLNARRRTARRAADALDPAALPDDGRVDTESLLRTAEELARVKGCILRMAKLQRSAVRLCLLDDAPQQAVAETLGITPGHLRVLLHRAREHIRTCDYANDPVDPVMD